MRIVLAVDGSDQALDAAKALEHFAPAEALVLVHVIHLPQVAYPMLGQKLPKDLALKAERALRDEGERILDHAVSMLPHHPGSVSRRLLTGTPAEVILKEAEDERADLIVMGARGLGPFRELAFGSVSHRISTHSPCSTLLVKQPLNRLDHVLMPVETNEDAEIALQFFLKKPFRKNVEVTVLNVIPFSEPAWPVGAMIPESFRKEMIGHGEALANDVASKLNTQGYAAQGVAIMAGSPSAAIIEESSAAEADLIALNSRSRHGIGRFLLGSVSHAIVHRASGSVLLIR